MEGSSTEPVEAETEFTEGVGPPPYTTADPSWKLTYVDFAPKCVVEGGIVTSAKFETFE